MRRLFLTAISIAAGILASAGMGAYGAPSGLNVIPTADILDAGTMSLETERAGPGWPLGGDCDQFVLLQVGVGNGLELGADQCLDPSDLWLNVKWRVQSESPESPGLVLGVQAIGDDQVAQPYVAAVKSVGRARIHVGLIGIDGNARLMLGLDRSLGSMIALQADYTTGDENSLSYGVALALGDRLSLTLARTLGNCAETGDGHIVNLAWTAGWR